MDKLDTFFFQAEDGIRDGRVTGVQTCALPISLATSSSIQLVDLATDESKSFPLHGANAGAGGRSEERRVGKECRRRWWPHQQQKKNGLRPCRLDHPYHARIQIRHLCTTCVPQR